MNNTPDKPNLSRRDFLKIAGAVGGGLVVSAVTPKTPDFLKYVDEYDGLVTGKVFDLEKIPSKIPDSLVGKDIPENNLWFKNADKILEDGISMYQSWQKKDSSLNNLFYSKPENYVDVPSLYNLLKNKTVPFWDEINIRDGVWNNIGYLYDLASEGFDIPYSRWFYSSIDTVKSTQNLIETDPGTGMVQKIRRFMKEKYGDGYEIWDSCKNNTLNEEQKSHIIQTSQKWFFDAMFYINKIRDQQKEPISTNLLFAYFLHENKGNILASTWDTTMWLKIISRNDPTKDFLFDPNYERAKQTCYLFKDEFSKTISANWVIDNVESNNEILNYIGDYAKYPEYKDYMPANRAGGLYHAWNIIALSMTMRPFLVKRITALQANLILTDNIRWTEHGKVKTIADMEVVSKADKIDRIINMFD